MNTNDPIQRLLVPLGQPGQPRWRLIWLRLRLAWLLRGHGQTPAAKYGITVRRPTLGERIRTTIRRLRWLMGVA